jgi:hypothetical protein
MEHYPTSSPITSIHESNRDEISHPVNMGHHIPQDSHVEIGCPTGVSILDRHPLAIPGPLQGAQEIEALIHELYDNRSIKLTEPMADYLLGNFQSLVKIYRDEDRSDEFMVLVDALDRLPHPTSLKKNTIGTYLYGCSQTDYGDVTGECVPICITGFSRKFKPEICPVQTLQIDQGRLISIIDPRTGRDYEPPRAIIYVSNDFTGLTADLLIQLRNLHITSISILIKRDNRYVRLLPFTPIDQLPLTLFQVNEPEELDASKLDSASSIVQIVREEHDNPQPDNCWIIFIVVAVIIILIGTLFVLSRTKYDWR